MKPTKVSGLSAGLCIPDSCKNKDLHAIINAIVNQYSPVDGIHMDGFYCTRQDDDAGLSPGGVALLVFLGLWGLLVVLATLFQAWCEEAESLPLPSQRQSVRRKSGMKVVAYHRTIEEEEEEEEQQPSSAQKTCWADPAVADEAGVRGDGCGFEDSITGCRGADEMANSRNTSGSGMDTTTAIPDAKLIGTDGGQTDLDPNGPGFGSNTNGISPSPYQTGASTDMAHTDTGVTCADTDMAHTNTDLTITDTGVAYTDTDMTHADADVTRTDTGVTYNHTDMSHADTDMTHIHSVKAHANTDMTNIHSVIAHANIDMAYTDADMACTYINVTHIDTITSHTYSDTAHADTDVTRTDTGVTYNHTDMPHADTDMTHIHRVIAHADIDTAYTDADMTHTDINVTHTDTITSQAYSDTVHADTDLTHANMDITECDTDMTHTDTDMAHTDTDMAHTDTDMAHTDTDMARTDTDMVHTDTDMAHTNTGMAHTNTDMTHTNTDMAHTDTDMTHIDTDMTHTDTDMAHIDTDMTRTNTDMTHTDTDMTRTNTDMTHTDTDTAHAETSDTNSEFSDAISDHTNTRVNQRHHEAISFAGLSPQHSVSRPSHTEEKEQIWQHASGDSEMYLSLTEDNDDEKNDRECDEHAAGISSRSPNESFSLVHDDDPDGAKKTVCFSETLTASLSTIEECSAEIDKDSVHTIPEKSIPFPEDSCHGITNIGPARGIVHGACKSIPSVVQDCSKARGWRRAARCLSLQHNIARLLKTTPEDRDLSCLHGIRVLSLAWGVLINVVIYQSFFSRNVWRLLQQWRNSRFIYPVISNGLLSLDSLLALSGLVDGYSCCRTTVEEEAGHRQAGLKRWLYILLHRYIRVTSVLILVTMAYVTLFPALTEGPVSMRESPDSQECTSWGWMCALLIQNMAPSSCMSWTWLQAVDFQLLLLATPVTYVLHRKPLLAYVVVAVLVAVSCAISAAVTANLHLPSSQFVLPRLENITSNFARSNRFETNYFSRPWAHAGAYLPSLLLGHYLQTSASPRPRLPFTGLVAGCLLAGGGAAGALWGAGTEMAGGPSLSTAAVALFNGVQRTVWGVAVSWVVLVCSTGHGGPVRAFLSWTGWRPLSRLALLVYILQPMVTLAFTSNLQQLSYMGGSHVLATFIPVLGYSFLLAAVLALAVHMPLTALVGSDGVLVLS